MNFPSPLLLLALLTTLFTACYTCPKTTIAEYERSTTDASYRELTVIGVESPPFDVCKHFCGDGRHAKLIGCVLYRVESTTDASLMSDLSPPVDMQRSVDAGSDLAKSDGVVDMGLPNDATPHDQDPWTEYRDFPIVRCRWMGAAVCPG